MEKDDFYKILNDNPELLKKYLDDNLLTKDEASIITNQSEGAFNQSVRTNIIQPFFSKEKNGRTVFKLYLKTEMIDYRKTKRNINKKKQ
ncbi:hypothetical protein H6231_002831 [Enterococcus hirae]|nr:hypothetical protein [Enterococcus hirae]